jgi:molybdate transport system ATP-binding protein
VTDLLDLDLKLPLDRFTLTLRWRTDERALGVFGPSGAGKTSLLEAIAGLRPEALGRVRVGGRTWLDSSRGVRLPPERRGVGYVPQDARLFPHKNVRENLLVGRRRAEKGQGARLDPERVLEVLELQGRETASITSLSGGERQRVALGRALCAAPELLLLDEPLGGIDLPLRRRILPYLLRVEREFGVPTILVTHDAAEVRLLSREAVVLIEGREAARGRPDDLFTGVELLARLGTAGHVNVLRGRVTAIAGLTVEIETGAGPPITAPAGGVSRKGEEVAILVRADELIVATESPHGLSAQNVMPGTVRTIIESRTMAESEDPALAVMVDVSSARAPLIAAVTPKASHRLGLSPGRSVFLVWKTHACRVVVAGSTREIE